MPGHMGAERRTTANLLVFKIFPELNLMVCGAPLAKGGSLSVERVFFGCRRWWAACPARRSPSSPSGTRTRSG